MGDILSAVLVLIALGLVAGLILLFGRGRFSRRMRAASEPTFGGSGPSRPDKSWLKKRDWVEASGFAPTEAARESWFRVEIAIHQPKDRAQFQTLAKDSQVARKRVGKLTRGQAVSVVLEGNVAEIQPPIRQIQWSGVPQIVAFRVRPGGDLKGDAVLLDALIFAGPIYIGSLSLSVSIKPDDVNVDSKQTNTSRPPRRVFISYSSDDRAEVLRVAQAYNALGIEVFQDVWSLRAGEDWENRLYSEIDRCDCFVLCWSRSAARSGWVEAEIKRALERQSMDPDRLPKIVTYPLEGPPIPKPPPSLAHLHFNDPLFLLRTSVQSVKSTDS